jgi:hypothetical protein
LVRITADYCGIKDDLGIKGKIRDIEINGNQRRISDPNY